VRAAADRLHIRLSIEHVTNQQEIEKTFASLSQLGAGAVFVLADPLFNDRSDQLVELQHRYSLPTAFAPESPAARLIGTPRKRTNSAGEVSDG
jgi:hypothetical protein